MLTESQAYEQGVSDSLKGQVYDALQALAQGFFDFPAMGWQHDAETIAAIHDNGLIVLYRLLFILYAEDRDLLPIHSNEAYRESYSLQALKQRIAREIDRPTGLAHHVGTVAAAAGVVGASSTGAMKAWAFPPTTAACSRPAIIPFWSTIGWAIRICAQAIDLLDSHPGPKDGQGGVRRLPRPGNPASGQHLRGAAGVQSRSRKPCGRVNGGEVFAGGGKSRVLAAV